MRRFVAMIGLVLAMVLALVACSAPPGDSGAGGAAPTPTPLSERPGY